MRSRWFHVPLLHTDADPPKRASWLALLYDLVFVAALMQLGEALAASVASQGLGEAFLGFAIHFVPLFTAWTGFTLYANRFDVDDVAHRVLVLLQMFAMGAIGILAPASMSTVDPAPAPFALAFGGAQILVALLYLRAYKHTPDARDYAGFWGVVFAVGGVVWGLSVLVPAPWHWVLWWLGAGSVLLMPFTTRSRMLAETYPIDREHMSQRYGMLILFVLGGGVLQLVGDMAELAGTHMGNGLTKGIAALMITACVWWTYFDDVAGSRIRAGRGAWIVWFFGHLPLAMALTAVGVALDAAIAEPLFETVTYELRWQLAGALAMTFGTVALIDSVTERRQAELSDRLRVNMRVGSAALVLLIGQGSSQLDLAQFLGLLVMLCLSQVLFDLVMVPFEDGQLFDDRAAPQAIPHTAVRSAAVRDPSQAVRRGVPSDLRSDLYAFFMSSSWATLGLVGTLGFVLINAAFALLYLADPMAVNGARAGNFFDTFAFSVQTMSTIGYGALSPGSPWGDAVATLEAVASILLVALATGLVFAKVSRPTARVLFSNVMVLTPWNGVPTLTFRVGNMRGSELVDAQVTFTVLLNEVTSEGHTMRRLKDLNLVRARTPLFVLSWTVQHTVDEDSPLHGFDWADEEAVSDLIFVVTLVGHEAIYGQTTYARAMYTGVDIRHGQRFIDVVERLPDGRTLLDYKHFHDTEAVV